MMPSLPVAVFLCVCGFIFSSDAQSPVPDLACPQLSASNVTGTCIQECENDASCEDGLKCCPNGCGTICVAGVNVSDIDECRDDSYCVNGVCRNTQGSFVCTCGRGYQLSRDSTTCIDMDECEASEETCMHGLCYNTEGSYICDCFEGYKLSVNEKYCYDASEQPRIVWTEVFTSERKSRINSLPADPTVYVGNSTISTKYKYQLTDHNFLAIAGDYEEGKIFFTDGITRKIYAGSLVDEVGADAIYVGTSSTVEGIAVDWVAKNLYWCDAGYDWIMIANYSGKNSRIVIDTGLDKPRDIVVYPQLGRMYWTDWGVNMTSISTATLAGDEPTAIVTDDLHYPNGLTIDYITDTIYWVDANPAGSRIESVLLNGTNRRLVYMSNQGQAHFFDVAVFQDYVFATDWVGNLQSVNRTSGAHYFGLALGTRPHSIMTYGPGLLPAYPTSPCVPNPCDQLCVHDAEVGEYKCICGHGYKTADDGTCVKEEGALVKPKVLLLSKTKLCYYPGNFPTLDIPEGYEAPCILRNRTHSVALAVDVHAGWAFFSDFQWKRLYRVRLDTSSTVEQISGAIGSVEGLAVDYINQNVYWTDYKLNHIVVSNYDGSHRVTLVDTDIIKPRNLIIHLETRTMFWTEFGPPYEIEQADLDGQNRRVLVTLASSPSGLAYDYITGRLIYGETGSGTIYSYHIATGVSSRIHSRLRLIPFYDMEVFGDYLVWTEWGSSNGIHALNLETGVIHQSQIVGEPVYGVRFYANIKQRANVTSADCGEDNGGCSQLCVGTGTGYMCYCSLGFQLADDGRTCLTGSLVTDNFALVTDSYEKTVFQVDLASEDHNFTGIAIPGLKNPIAIDYDPMAEKFYVSDVIGKKIIRANLNGSALETIASDNILIPDGLAIDYMSGLLYWTDAGADVISVSYLDGSHRRTLIKEDLDKPRPITLLPFDGIMFYSDWGSQPKIETAYMDGTHRNIIVSTDIAWANGLAVDKKASRLFWCDAKTDVIESVQYDGSDRRVFLEDGIVHPFGIAVFEDFIYWSEWTRRGLMRANRMLPTNETTASLIGAESFLRINGIVTFSRSSIPEGETQCSENNGGCGQLCLLSPQGRTCQCEDGSGLLEDGVNCREQEDLCPLTIPNGKFAYHCDRTPGAQCSVICDRGFKASQTNYTCSAVYEAAEWEYSLDYMCREVQCSFLPTTANVEANQCLPPHGFESICSFRCRDGFTYHNGSNDRTCRQDGTWSGEELHCIPITCPSLSPPSNGMFVPPSCLNSEMALDGECRLFCSQGYQSSGATVMTCLASGTWSVDTSSVQCLDTTPPTFNNTCPSQPINVTAPAGLTTYPYAGTELGAMDNSGQVTVSYNLPPYPTVSLSEGLHIIVQIATDPSGNTAVCDYTVNVTVNHCALLMTPFNTDMSEACSTHFGAVCRFRCNDGFRLIGNESSTCIQSSSGDFVWSSRPPRCEAVTCPDPGVPDGSIRFGCSPPFAANRLCSFVCPRSFEKVSGSDRRMCQLSGEWSGTPIQCSLIKCPATAPILNGAVFPPDCLTDGIAAGRACLYTCNEGYQLSGLPIHVCSRDGGWLTADAPRVCEDNRAPHFNGTCPANQTIIAGTGQMTAPAVWTDPTVVDREGHVMNVTSTPQKGALLSEGTHGVVIHALDDAGNGGSCSFSIQVKVIRCPVYSGAIPNDCSGLRGTECTFSCNPGYRLVGTDSLTCTWDGQSDNGTWSAEEPTCEAITCPRFGLPEGGHMTGCSFDVERIPYGSICNLHCMKGYSQYEGAQKKCSENGTWIGPDLICDRVTCDGIFPSLHSKVQPASCRNHTEYTSTCTFNCAEGFSMIGSPNRTCLASGQWDFDGQSPICIQDDLPPTEEGDCPDQLNVTISEACKETARFESSIDGWLVELPPQTRLGAGIHNISAPVTGPSSIRRFCEFRVNITVRSCPLLTSDLLSALTCSNTYGSRATFACPSSQQLIGSDESICQSDGTWSAEEPTCEDVTCPLPSLPSGFALSDGCVSTPDSQCTVQCLINPDVTPFRILCVVDGNWINAVTRLPFDRRSLQLAECIDATPPVITCPPNIEQELPSDSDVVIVTWSLPNVTDLHDPSPFISLAPPPPPRTMTSGTYTRSYHARDQQGNTAQCSFTIQINDVTPPISTTCPNETVILPVDSITDTFTWDVPSFTDNAGVVDRSGGEMLGTPVGKYGPIEVTYTASDYANNEGQCTFTVDVVQRAGGCSILDVPLNGRKSCDDVQNRCTISCNTGYTFVPSDSGDRTYLSPGDRSSIVFECIANQWKSGSIYKFKPVVPNCGVVIRNNIRLDVAVFNVARDPCAGNEEAVGANFLELFAATRFSAICNADPQLSCDVTNVQVECPGPPGHTGPIGRRSTYLMVASVTYVIHGISNSSFAALDQAFNLSISEFFGDATTLSLSADTGATLLPYMSRQGILMTNCTAGAQPFELVCITCPPGTYFRMRTQTCTKCPIGQHQDEPGQTRCKRCHTGLSTRAPGAPSSEYCRHECQPGSYSYSGLGPCQDCPYGTYQPIHGSRGCLFCPAGTNTTRKRATYSSDCRAPTTTPVPTTGVDVVVITTQSVPTTATTRTPTTQPNVPPVTNNTVIITTPGKTIPTKADEGPGKKDETTEKKKPEQKTDPPKSDQSQQKGGGGGIQWVWVIVGISALVCIVVIVVLVLYVKRRRQYGHNRLYDSHEGYDDEMMDARHSTLKPEETAGVVAFQNPAFADVEL